MRTRASAFTLVEMLAVMAVIVILISLVTPVVITVLKGNGMTQSGEMVGDQFVLARQAAMTSNRPVEVRFYQLPVASIGAASNYAGMQIYRDDDSGPTPLNKLQLLRTSVIFSSIGRYSSIITPPSGTAPVTGSQQIPAFNNAACTYVGFHFLPNGSTDLDLTAASGVGGWFVTLLDANLPAPAGQPQNFYTVRVDPLSGHTRIFRP